MMDRKSESEVTVVREDDGERAYGEGLSVFGLICDVLGLRPLYKPHRNGDAIRVAKLLGRMIKEKLCVRRMGNSGRLGWVFESADNYRDAMQILNEEPSVCQFH